MADYRIQPGKLSIYGTSSFNPTELQQDHGTEYFAYINDEIVLSEKLSVAAGLRYAYFVKKGPADTYIYEEGRPRSETSITDTLFYGKGDVAQTYHGLEPRASVKYSLTPTSSVKAGYSRTRQYIQIISNTATITPVDVWRLSNRYIQPQIADQFSVGYFSITPNNAYELSWEVYYKKLMHQVDYKDGATILLNPTLEADLLFGSGTAYGSEWLIKKNVGKLNGWVSFTYARSFRTIAGSTEEETINNGVQYPSNYDKPFNLNIFTNYQLSTRWTFSANFNYSTGRPITASDSWFRYFNTIFSNYQGRNQQRMPDYHRLDLSLNFNAPPEKKVQTSWSVSVYNLYLWNNAYSTLFKHYYGSPVGAYKLAIIGIAVPSVSFNIKF
jgi:outer membrane receptor protein involved in Fe transport